MNRTRTAAFVALAILLAACGGDDDGGDAAPASSTSTTASVTSVTEAEPDVDDGVDTPESSSVPSSAPSATTSSSAPTTTAASRAPSTVDVDIVDFDFTPTAVEVSVGDTVRWTHVGDIAHTVTSNSAGFDSGTLNSGDTFEFQASTPGSYSYACLFHSSMQGTITVTA